jgi:hypothetical protein
MVVNERTCTRCPALTRRKDGLCPNCNVTLRPFQRFNQPIEEGIMRRLGSKCVECGLTDTHVLKLVHNIGMNGGIVCPCAIDPSVELSMLASENPKPHIIRCHNC